MSEPEALPVLSSFTKLSPDHSTWKGRRRRGERDNHSFKSFVDSVKDTKAGKAHLEHHHGGYGL